MKIGGTLGALRRAAILRTVGAWIKVVLSGPLGLLYTAAPFLLPQEPLLKRAAMGLTGLVLLFVAYWSEVYPIFRTRRIRRAGHDYRRWIGNPRC